MPASASQPEVEMIEHVNMLTEKRFSLEVELETLKNEYKKEEDELKKRYAPHLELIEASVAEVDKELFDFISDNQDILIDKDKRSFATLIGVFQFKRSSQAVKVVDTEGVMDMARRVGVVKQIADLVHHYKLNRRKFTAWLESNPRYLEVFDEYLEANDTESLTIRPNSTYVVTHKRRRISPPGVTIRGDKPR